MSRDNITNKGSSQKDKPKSEWFGFKYRVNPETSKLLQEAVFKDGGKWAGSGGTTLMGTYMEYIYVTYDGIMSYGNSRGIFNEEDLPEKEPPQPNKTLNEQFNDLINRLKTTDSKNGVYWSGESNARPIEKQQWISDRSDVKHFEIYKRHNHEGLCEEIPLTISPIECTLVKARPESKTSDFEYKPNLKFLNQQEESNMTQVTTRKTVTVNLIDRDSALDEKYSVVANFGQFTTSKSTEALIRSIIMEPKNKVAELIAQHNEVRTKQTNKEILNRTGNKVYLEPVEESDLYWEIQ